MFLSIFCVPEVILGRQWEAVHNKHGFSQQCSSSEAVNRSIMEVIRMHIGIKVHNQWDFDLSSIEIAFRSSLHSSIGISPYYALFRRKVITHASSYPLLRKLTAINDGVIKVVSQADHMKIIDETIIKCLKKVLAKILNYIIEN